MKVLVPQKGKWKRKREKAKRIKKIKKMKGRRNLTDHSVLQMQLNPPPGQPS